MVYFVKDVELDVVSAIDTLFKDLRVSKDEI